MARQKLIQEYDFEIAAVPKDTTTTAIAGDWITMKNATQMAIVIQQGAWEANNTPAVTLNQATSNAGANSKALSFTEKWSKVALAANVFARADVSSDTFNLPDTADTMTLIEISCESLDRDNGFDYVQLAVADANGGNPCLSGALVILGGLRNQGNPAVILDDPKA